jgi:translation initiation factor 5B
VTSIEMNHKALDVAPKAAEVAIKIETDQGEGQRSFGRHFDEKDELVSKISRQSIDAIKESFRDQLSKEDIILLSKLKKLFTIE